MGVAFIERRLSLLILFFIFDDVVISQLIEHVEKGTRPTAKRVSGNISSVLRYLQDWDNLELQEGVLF
jgi:hypothetical protein